jgi:membrane fusion protein, adhesin transport system
MAKQRVRSAREALESARATSNTAKFQLERMQHLLGEGIVSRRDFEVAERDEIVAHRSVNSALASLDAAQAEQRAAEAEVEQLRTDSQARIESTGGAASRLRADIEDSRLALREIEVRLSRQREQVVKAPRGGSVFRLLGNPAGSVIREGEPLLILVPETTLPAVELWVSGNDAPLISEGRKARLQFEGWPALQFRGWSELAVGTFGGVVSFVDAADDGSGRFRVMVTPDPEEAPTPWPSSRFLRQGARVRGWILLGKVSLAYEIWRQLNGFPPMEAMELGPEDLARQRSQ